MENKTALITGATSGFGKVLARYLIKKGYLLLIVGRSEAKINALKKELSSSKVESYVCDLASLKSVQAVCQQVKREHQQIDLLMLNAGVWNFEFKETEDGIEETFQVNLLAPILMFEQLKELLPRNPETKVLFTASGLHQGNIQFDDIEYRKSFSGFKAYRQSKLGLILMTRLLAKKQANISFYSVHPGVVNTQLGRNAGWFSRLIFKLIGTSVEKGARTHIHLLETAASELRSGGYYANSKLNAATKESNDMVLAEKLAETINGYLKKIE